MDKREEIRGELEKIWCEDCEYHTSFDVRSGCSAKIDKILQCFHDRGVVIKVDRKYTSNPICDDYMNGLGFLVEHGRTPTERELDRYIKALGYVAVEPLIEEQKMSKIEGRLLTGDDWERVNTKCGFDVMDIIINLDNRYTKNEQMEMIARRCDKTAKAQRDLTASEKDKECLQRIQAVEETLTKLYQQSQEQWIDSLLEKEAECQAKVGRILDSFERSRVLDGSMWWRVMPEEDWQALKEKELD